MKLIQQRPDVFSLLAKHRKSIMGFAAIYILAFHKYICLFPQGNLFFQIEYGIKELGLSGVDIFLFLSGIGLTYSIGKTSLGIFYYKRIKRIIIPFVLIGIARGLFDRLSFMDILGNISGINFWIRDVNSLLWFIPAIAALYFVFPFYYKAFLKAKNKMVFTGIIVCIWLFLSMLLAGSIERLGRGDLYLFTNRIPVFTIGVLFGWLSQGKSLRFSASNWLLLLLINCVGLYVGFQVVFHNWYLFVPITITFIPSILIAISLTLILSYVFELLSFSKVGSFITNFFSIIGTVSLEFYCVQGAVDFVVKSYFSNLPNAVLNILVFVTVFIASYVLYFIELGFWKIAELFQKN